MSTATADRPTQAVPPQRDSKGRFTRNNAGGPGNPFGRRIAELRSILLRAATDENVERLAHMLMEKAFTGDLAAAKLLLLYWIGKPKEVAEPDRQDVEEWNLARDGMVDVDALHETFSQVPTTLGVDLLPTFAEAQVRTMADMFAHPENYRPADEPTPEELERELAEEAEWLRERRAAREAAAAAQAAAPPSPSARPAADRAPAPSGAQPHADVHVAPLPSLAAFVGSPSPNGGAAGAPPRLSSTDGPSHGKRHRAG
jgi:hypothetical protein